MSALCHGEVLYPVPWARDPSISHLATPDEMNSGASGLSALCQQLILMKRKTLPQGA